MAMSSTSSKVYNLQMPVWFSELLGLQEKLDKQEFVLRDVAEKLKFKDGILRADTVLSKQQSQTEAVFGFKWQKRDST